LEADIADDIDRISE